MPKREWISKEHKIYRMEGGGVYARPTIPGIGRREFPLGKKHTGPIDYKTIQLYIKLAKREIAEIVRGQKKKPASLIRFEDLATEIIALKEGLAEATYESAKIHFEKHLVPWFNTHYPYVDQINETVWEEYVRQQLKKKPRKLFNDWKHMGMLLRHAHQKGVLPRVIKIRNPDPRTDAGRRLNEAEVRRLLAFANDELKLQILMAVTMGMRKSEILKLEWDRVDLKNKTIHLRAKDTKIRRSRTMGISPAVFDRLRAERPESRFVFVFPSRYTHALPSVSNKTAWTACKRRAGLKVRFHDLRHTFLSIVLLEKKMNPLHVAVYAGVSLSEIQKTYLHPSVEDTRDVAVALGETWGKNNDSL